MSKRETPLSRKYWKSVGGTLIEEYVIVPRGQNHGTRLMDGVIIVNGPMEIASQKDVDISGKDIIVIQTKASRLGMSLMGQALFSIELMKRHQPKSIRSVAICTRGDDILESILSDYPEIELVVYDT